MTNAQTAHPERLKTLGEADLALLVHCLATLPQLDPRPASFRPSGTGLREPDSVLLAEAAREQDLLVQPLAANLQIIRGRDRYVGFSDGMSSYLSTTDRVIANNRLLCHRLLRSRGVRTLELAPAETLRDAHELFESLAAPVTVLPAARKGLEGVSFWVSSHDELDIAYRHARKHSRLVILRRSKPALHLRMLVLEGQVVSILLRAPAYVVGNGLNSIAELTTDRNNTLARAPYPRRRSVRLDETTEQHLLSTGASFDTVPPRGQIVFLSGRPVPAAGGELISVTDLVSEGVRNVGASGLNCFASAQHGNIDVSTESLLSSSAASIDDINLNPDISAHQFPTRGTPTDPAAELLRAHFAPRSAPESTRTDPGSAAPRPDNPILSLRQRVANRRSRAASCHSLALLANRTLAIDPTSGAPDSVGELENSGLQNALQALGFCHVTFHKDRIHFERGGDLVVLDRWGRTVFATHLTKDRTAFENLLADAAIPYTRHISLAYSELDLASAVVAQARGYWSLTDTSGEPPTPRALRIRTTSQLRKAWDQLDGSAATAMTLAETSPCHRWRLLMFGTEAVAAIAIHPPTVIGDGATTLGQLIDSKSAHRANNPHLQHHPIPKQLMGRRALARQQLRLDDVIDTSRIVTLGPANTAAQGADVTSHERASLNELASLASRAVSLLGAPTVAAVSILKVRRGGKSHWAVDAVDLDPPIAEFAYSLNEQNLNIYQQVARRITQSPTQVVINQDV